MNNWNYTKKAGKIGLIYGLLILIVIQSAYFLAPYPEAATNEDVYQTRDNINTLGLLMILPLFVPLSFLGSFCGSLNPAVWGLIIPLSSTLIAAFLGLVMDFFYYSSDLYRKNQTEKTEKGVFIRIPLGDSQIVISERIISCFIIAEIVLVVLMVGVQSSGVLDRIVVKGGYDGYDYENGSAISFNSELNTFTQKKFGISKSGTYVINGTVLTLYYSDGNTTRYSIHDLGLRLFSMDKSRFINGREWGEEEYLKPVFM